ncbi:MAG: ABC transporter permease, partial [Beijerinckiaceae bacterium]
MTAATLRQPGSAIPVSAITALILGVWYLACLPMNADLPQMANVQGLANRYAVAWSLERPVLPAPHQVIVELYNSTLGTSIIRQTADGWMLSPRNLFFHA